MAVRKPKSKSDRQLVDVKEHVFGEWQSMSRKELIAEIDSAINHIPKQYRDSVTFSVAHEYSDPYSESQSAYFCISWKRHENDEEYSLRIKREEAQLLAREEHERREFERLSAKFGNK